MVAILTKGGLTMGASTSGEQRGRPVEETSPRVLYWWRVPERPGVGKQMVIFAAVWLLTILAVLVIIGVISAVVF